MRTLPCALLAAACNAVEPLDLPEDPASTGTPVGVRTMDIGGYTSEVWYPAPDRFADEPTESVDYRMFVSAEVDAALGEYELPLIPTIAVRDADLRHVEEPFPVVIFSHGFGGTRLQSVDFTTHLASRGYVVVATDHEGRSMPDLLPCLFLPPLDGCDLAVGGGDPAVGDVEALVDGLEALDEDDPLSGHLDLDAVGLAGHSAGGRTTAEAGQEDERFRALLPMASGSSITRDVPVLRMGGTCDGIATWPGVFDGDAAGVGDLVGVLGAGHLAFTDLCTLELGAFAATWLEGRDDINDVLLDGFVDLATDGCPGVAPADPRPECAESYLPLEDSTAVIRHYATLFFDDALAGRGGGVEGALEYATLNPGSP